MMYRFRTIFNKGFLLGTLMFSMVNILTAQDSFTVEGIVLAGPGQPVANATVSIEGSVEMPVVTGESGTFTLQAQTGHEWIIVSPPIGYKELRVNLNNREEVTIYLTPENISSGHDVITIFSQSVEKRNIVASVENLDIQNMHHTPALSVDQYMEGRIPGMHVVNRSGAPASGAATMIRGLNSINTSNQPLFVVDGIPMLAHGVFGSNLHGYEYNPLLAINPYDISKTSVIKDPVVSAAYGSKGSNGIIFIETLDPSVTETTIDLDIRGGYSLAPPTFIPQLNAQQHKTLLNEVLYSSPLFEEQIREEYPNLFLTPEDERFINYQHNTLWQDYVYSNSYFSNINLIVKGGDEIARYGLSFGYTSSDGIVRNTGYEGYNLRFVSRLNMFTWLSMNAGVALNYSSSMLKETTSANGTSPVLASLAISPLLGPYQYDLEEQRLTRLSEVDELGVSNPLAIIENYSADNDNYNFISNLNFRSTISDNFSLNTDLSLSYNVLKESVFMPNQGMALYYNQEAINVAKVTNNSITTFYNNSYALYQRTFGEHHNISSSTGIHTQTNQFELDWGLTKNAHENDRYRSIQHGQNNLRELGGQSRKWNWVSLYEYVNYSYRDKYLLSASLSIDGSSRVGKNAENTIPLLGHQFGLFYGGGIGWRVSSEPFMKSIPWLDELKIRASYGKSGNDDIGEASATRYYQSARYRETSGLYPAVLYNDKLTYETVNQINSGVDFSMWGNRISAKMDYFISTTDDMLVYSPIEAYFGYDTRVENGGSMENKGWEFSSFTRLVDGHAFKWDINVSVTSVKNEVTSVKGDRLVTDINSAQIVNQPGFPANSFYGYLYQGVYTTRDQASSSGLVNNRGIRYQAGDAIYADISGPDGEPDGVINEFDKTVIGSSVPDFFGGLMNTFYYGRFSLSGFVQFVSGIDVFNYVRYQNERMSGLENQSTATLNRWQYEGHKTSMPRALWNDPIGNSSFSSRWIEDASYVRLKNITISYTIPTEFLAFKSAEFYFSANNLFVFSNYLGYDPEFSHSFANRGIDYGQSPHPRQFIGGIKFGL